MPKIVAAADYAALDGNRSCICPFCGRRSRLNNLLFRTGRQLPAGTDRILDRYQMEFGQVSQSSGNELAATKSPAVLFDWRSCEARDVALEQGVVTAVTDCYGQQFRERVCPACHNELPGWVYTLPSMICFAQNSADAEMLVEAFGTRAFCTCAGQKIVRMERKWACYLLDSEVPALLAHRQREANLCHEADRMIVVCRLDETAGDNGSIDQETQEWMRNLLLQRFSSQNVGCKTLVIIRTNALIGIDEMRTRHNVLYAHINAHFPDNRISIWELGQGAPAGLNEGLEWLISES